MTGESSNACRHCRSLFSTSRREHHPQHATECTQATRVLSAAVADVEAAGGLMQSKRPGCAGTHTRKGTGRLTEPTQRRLLHARMPLRASAKAESGRWWRCRQRRTTTRGETEPDPARTSRKRASGRGRRNSCNSASSSASSGPTWGRRHDVTSNRRSRRRSRRWSRQPAEQAFTERGAGVWLDQRVVHACSRCSNRSINTCRTPHAANGHRHSLHDRSQPCAPASMQRSASDWSALAVTAITGIERFLASGNSRMARAAVSPSITAVRRSTAKARGHGH